MTGTSPPSPRPDCECHGEPSYWHKDPRYLIGGFWYCGVAQRVRTSGYYDALRGVAYNRMLLKKRRVKALERRRNREVASGAV